jgi:hypothetical protein
VSTRRKRQQQNACKQNKKAIYIIITIIINGIQVFVFPCRLNNPVIGCKMGTNKKGKATTKHEITHYKRGS